MRILCHEFRQSHLVVVSLRVTKFCVRLRHLSQFSFETHHVLHLLLGSLGIEAEHLEHSYDVLLVSLSDCSCSRVCIQVIFFLSEGGTALHYVQDILFGILLVGSKIHADEFAVAIRHKLQLNLEQSLLGLSLLHLLQDWHEWRNAICVAALLVHSKLIQIAELLLNGAFTIGILKQFLQNTVDALVVIFAQHIEAAITGISSWQRILLHPTATSVMEKVVLWLDAVVHVGHVETRMQLLRLRILCHRGHRYCVQCHNRNN